MPELSPEDALRLNVLLANELHAVRIDESSMTLYALTPQGDTSIRLNPTCRDEQYLKAVRELLSERVLGSPGGYPVFIRRWTRMGQARGEESLGKLLLLGEPEAVVAVVHAPVLTDEIARRAWWAMQTSENARRLLACEAVAQGSMGPVLAEFLLEFLPFEESPQAVIETVRLVLQPGLIGEEAKQKLWARARSKNPYYVGFMQALPDDLPEQAPPHPEWQARRDLLQDLAEGGNAVAGLLARCLSGPGQAFLATAQAAMRKPGNQEVAVELAEALGSYFAPVALPGCRPMDMAPLEAQAEARPQGMEGDPLADDFRAVLDAWPESRPLLSALCLLSGAGERLLAPIFARTDAVGSVMRKKIAPVFTPLGEAIQVLRGGKGK